MVTKSVTKPAWLNFNYAFCDVNAAFVEHQNRCRSIIKMTAMADFISSKIGNEVVPLDDLWSLSNEALDDLLEFVTELYQVVREEYVVAEKRSL
jgi:hypothetical protein